MNKEVPITGELIHAIKMISSLYNCSFSKEVLCTGLPMPDGNVDYSQLKNACRNIGLIVDFADFNISQLIKRAAPFIAETKEYQYLVISRIDVKTVVCLTSKGEVEISVDELKQLVVGKVACISSQVDVEPRAKVNRLAIKREHWFWSSLFSVKSIYLDVLVASVLINIFAVVTPLFTMNVYDRVVPNLAFDSLWVLAVGASIVFLFDFVMKIMRSWFVDVAGKKIDVMMSAAIYARTLGMKLSHRPESVGVYSRHLQEFETVRSFLTSSTILTLIDLPFALFMLSMIWFIAGPLAVIPFTAMVLVAGYSLLMQRPLNRAIDESNELSAQKNANLYESLQGVDTIKIYGAEGQFQFKWEQAVSHMAHWGNKSRLLSNSITSVAGFAQQLVGVGIVVFGVYQLADNALSMGAIIASVMLSSRCLQPMIQIAGLSTKYSQVISAYQTLDDIMQTPQEQNPEKRYTERQALVGNIDFRQVNFQYNDKQHPTLSDISFSISKGEKVAIIGRIGAGKTTIEKLLLHLYQPTSGAIYLDGININQLNPVFVRHQINAMPQDIQLFYGSIRDNICFGNPTASSDAIQDAVDRAGISQFASHDSEGLDRQVGEGGRYLSGGQRQSIALARAFLNPAHIYVLDEPTSQMDTRIENHVKQQLAQLGQDETLLLVTHKTTMLDVVDRVIVLEQGRIIADGPKQEILNSLVEGRIRYPGGKHAA